MSDDGSDEREFLHNLASPLSTAIFLVDAALDNIQSRPEANADDVMQLVDAYQALERVKMLLQERREILIKRGVTSART